MDEPADACSTIAHRVVLAEDGEDDRALAFRALRKCRSSLVVQVAADGQRVLDLLLEDGAQAPRLILLDIKMPLMSGIDVLEKLRMDARFDEIPIVMLTSSDEPSDISRSRRLKADSYVRKPVEYEEYLLVLREVADFWLSEGYNPAKPPHCLLNGSLSA